MKSVVETSQIRPESGPDVRRDGPDASEHRVSHPHSSSSSTPIDDSVYAIIDSGFEDINAPVTPKLMRDPDDQTAVSTKKWSLEYLFELGMKPVERVAAMESPERLRDAIRKYEDEGIPMIIDKWDETPSWPKDDGKMFGIDWLLEHGEQTITARNCVDRTDDEMTLSEFVNLSRTTPHFSEEDEAARYYGKDAVCPKEWREWLMRSQLPEELLPGGPEDVLEILDGSERVETLMCYLGIGDTYTAAHKDLCASSGHNLMCYTEDGGSSYWFMTRSSDVPLVASWFQNLGYEIDHETYVVSPEEFAKAPFRVYVAEQKLGDLVLVPKRSCHQVVNYGGLTVKMSWSRMTVDGLVTAFHHELPVYRRVCRRETYRVKLLTYRALLRYSEELRVIHDSTASMPTPLSVLSSPSRTPTPPRKAVSTARQRALYDRVCKLLKLFEKIIKEECNSEVKCELRTAPLCASMSDSSGNIEEIPSSSQASLQALPSATIGAVDGLTCDFCGADIFQSFFECKTCISSKRDEGLVVKQESPPSDPTAPSERDPVIICPCCYVEGRACRCKMMNPIQIHAMEKLFDKQNHVAKLLNQDTIKKGESTRFVLLTEETLKTVQHPRIFASACKLLSERRKLQENEKLKLSRSCSKFHPHIHPAPTVSVLGCKKCHNACCFTHILRMGFHSSEALMKHGKDKHDASWHTLHAKRRAELQDLTVDARQAEKEGTQSDMNISLMLYARTYSVCFPFNTETIRKGWYDEYSLVKIEEDELPQGPRGYVKRKLKRTYKAIAAESDEETSPHKLPSRSPFPSAGTISREHSSSLTALSESDTASKRRAYIEVNKSNSAKLKRYGRTDSKKPDLAEIARKAASIQPQSLEETFRGTYGGIANGSLSKKLPESASTSSAKQPTASTSKSKQLGRTSTAKRLLDGRAASMESISSSEIRRDRKKQKVVVESDSDAEFRPAARTTKVKKEPSNASGFDGRPKRLRKPSRKRMQESEPEFETDSEVETLSWKGQREDTVDSQRTKKPRIGQPKSSLPKFTKKKSEGASSATLIKASAPVAEGAAATPSTSPVNIALPDSPVNARPSTSRPDPQPKVNAISNRTMRSSIRPSIVHPDTPSASLENGLVNNAHDLLKKIEDLQARHAQFEVEAKKEVFGLLSENKFLTLKVEHCLENIKKLESTAQQQEAVIEQQRALIMELHKMVNRHEGFLQSLQNGAVRTPGVGPPALPQGGDIAAGTSRDVMVDCYYGRRTNDTHQHISDSRAHTAHRHSRSPETPTKRLPQPPSQSHSPSQRSASQKRPFSDRRDVSPHGLSTGPARSRPRTNTDPRHPPSSPTLTTESPRLGEPTPSTPSLRQNRATGPPSSR